MQMNDDGSLSPLNSDPAKKFNRLDSSESAAECKTGANSNCLSRWCRCFNRKSSYQKMNVEQRKARIKYLWKRLRLVVRHRGLLQRLMYETMQNERKRFGLDPSIP